MQVEIQDSQVKGIVVVLKDDDGTSPWYMRLTSPGIEASAEEMGKDRAYIWYSMTQSGWEVMDGTALEAAYQEQFQ